MPCSVPKDSWSTSLSLTLEVASPKEEIHDVASDGLPSFKTAWYKKGSQENLKKKVMINETSSRNEKIMPTSKDKMNKLVNGTHTKLESMTSDGGSIFKLFIISSRARLKNKLRQPNHNRNQALQFNIEYMNLIHYQSR